MRFLLIHPQCNKFFCLETFKFVGFIKFFFSFSFLFFVFDFWVFLYLLFRRFWGSQVGKREGLCLGMNLCTPTAARPHDSSNCQSSPLDNIGVFWFAERKRENLLVCKDRKCCMKKKKLQNRKYVVNFCSSINSR